MHSGQTDLMEKSTLLAKEERSAAPQEIEPLDSLYTATYRSEWNRKVDAAQTSVSKTSTH